MKATYKNNNQGFTLIELMVVILIMGLLIGIVGPKLIGRSDDAKVSAAKIQIESLSSALKMYKLDNGTYPSTEQGLEALVSQPQSGDIPKRWKEGGYIDGKRVPQDPWHHDYIYMYPSAQDPTGFDIISYGADGQAGGDGYNKDITNWDEE